MQSLSPTPISYYLCFLISSSFTIILYYTAFQNIWWMDTNHNNEYYCGWCPSTTYSGILYNYVILHNGFILITSVCVINGQVAGIIHIMEGNFLDSECHTFFIMHTMDLINLLFHSSTQLLLNFIIISLFSCGLTCIGPCSEVLFSASAPSLL